MNDVSIILVNYKTKDLALRCLESVYKKTTDINFDVYVIDNASYDGIKEELEKQFPNVKFIQSKENNGFGAGNNIALKIFDSKYAFLINTDTILINNAAKILFDFMEANPEIGACGGNLYDEKGNNIHSYGVFHNLKDLFLKTFFLRYFFPKNEKRLKDKGLNKENLTKSVDFITGADLMLRKEALDKAGLFDERFFMYAEESPKKREHMYYEFLKSKYLYFKLCFGTKNNILFIKYLIILSTISKAIMHREAIFKLYKYILKDGDEKC